MKNLHGIAICLLLFVSMLSNPGYSEEANQYNLYQHIEKYRAKEKLSYKQLNSMLFDLVLSQEAIPKGRIGALGDEVYVILDSSFNEVLINGKNFKGLGRAIQQTIFTDGQTILNSKSAKDINKMIMIVFFPSKVQYINFKEKVAGYFDRNLK